jgi:hypothetical protein
MAKLAWRYADTFEFMEQTRSGFPPAMICVACNGGIQGRETHDKLPESPDEIADSVAAAYDAGASMMGAQTASYPTPENVLQMLKELRKTSTPAETRKLLGLPAAPLGQSSQRAIT